MAVDDQIAVKDAVHQLFGVERYSRIPKLRNSVNTLIGALKKKGVLRDANAPIEFTSSERVRWYLLRVDLTTFYNAIILQGVYSDP